MTSRRDLLKYFSAGTIITGVAGRETAQAILVEPPKVELVQSIPEIDLGRMKSVTLQFEHFDGSRASIKLDTSGGEGKIPVGARMRVSIAIQDLQDTYPYCAVSGKPKRIYGWGRL